MFNFLSFTIPWKLHVFNFRIMNITQSNWWIIYFLGMMDIALITANANQLRYIIEFNRNSVTFYLNVVLISISLLLQVGVGLALIFKGKMDIKGHSKSPRARQINNYVVVGVFLVTIINVFIASFTITSPSTGSSVTASTVPITPINVSQWVNVFIVFIFINEANLFYFCIPFKFPQENTLVG